MNYSELVQLYFERSTSLQSYWTVYLVISASLLGFSSLRKRPALTTTALVTVLFLCFAYKNLDAIREVVQQRAAVLQAIDSAATGGGADNTAQRAVLNPTMTAPAYSGVRAYHLSVDALVLLAFWAMEFRRRRMEREDRLLGPTVDRAA